MIADPVDLKLTYSHEEFSRIIHHVDKTAIIDGFKTDIISYTNRGNLFTITLNVSPGSIYVNIDNTVYLIVSEEDERIYIESQATVQMIGLTYDTDLKNVKVEHIKEAKEGTPERNIIPFANVYMDRYNDLWKIETLVDYSVKQCFFFDQKNAINFRQRIKDNVPPIQRPPEKLPPDKKKPGHWQDFPTIKNWSVEELIPDTYKKPEKKEPPPEKRPPDDDPPPDKRPPPPVQHHWTNQWKDHNRNQSDPWVTLPAAPNAVWYAQIQVDSIELTSGKDRDLKVITVGITTADMRCEGYTTTGMQLQERIGRRDTKGDSGYSTVKYGDWYSSGELNNGSGYRLDSGWMWVTGSLRGSYRSEVYGCCYYNNVGVTIGRSNLGWDTGHAVRYEWQFCDANHSHFDSYKEEDCNWVTKSKTVEIKPNVEQVNNNKKKE